MRITLLWQGISGYLAACWKALAATPGIELSILSSPSFRNYDTAMLAGLDCHVMTEQENQHPHFCKDWILPRKPEIILLCGWTNPIWNRLPDLPEFRNTPFILAFDTPWRGGLRQRLAPFKLRHLLSRMDCALIPGERAWQYARRLGFPQSKIRRGMYGIDYDMLAPLYDRRLAEKPAAPPRDSWPKKFLYVGRYAEEKAIDVLVESYRLYCQHAENPWPLSTCGAGPQAKLLANIPNLTDRGFIQPKDQADIWAAHGAFVLPSRSDPWPLVIVEACAAGLPIICTESCGSSVELVRSHFNGLPVAADNPQALANAMQWMQENYHQCPAMGSRSRQFAAAYSAQMWARRVTHLCGELSRG